MKRLLHEPLIHFLILGAILFGVYAYVERGHGGAEQSKQIRLTTDDLSQMVLVFQSQWRRDPTPEELRQLVEEKVHEEVLIAKRSRSASTRTTPSSSAAWRRRCNSWRKMWPPLTSRARRS